MDETMIRSDRQISDEESFEILRKGDYGILSMCTPNNSAYGIPFSYVLVNREIYFHCATKGSKLDYLRNNNKVSFCVVGNTKVLPSKFAALYESAIVFGTTSEVDGEEKRSTLMHFIDKYSSDYIEEGLKIIDKSYEKVIIIKLSIESVAGKAKKK